VIADIPGLIEGASEGRGGHEFLAHVERTRLLVHVVDLAPLDGSDPRENYETVEAELGGYGSGLGALPRILALSKADLVTARPPRRHARVVARLGDSVLDVVVVSRPASGWTIWRIGRSNVRRSSRSPRGARGQAEHRVYRPGAEDSYASSGAATGCSV